MFPSLAIMSYDKFDQEFVTRVFEDRQTFHVTFYVLRQCFLVWPGIYRDTGLETLYNMKRKIAFLLLEFFLFGLTNFLLYELNTLKRNNNRPT